MLDRAANGLLRVAAVLALAAGCGGSTSTVHGGDAGGQAAASSSSGGTPSSGSGSGSGAGGNGGGSSGGSGGGMNGSSGGSSGGNGSSSGAGGSSAAMICDNACAALHSCGAIVSPTCSKDCQAAPQTYLDCLRATGNDCNAISLCFFSAVCGGNGPSGTLSCAATAGCEGYCNANNATVACGCACIRAMTPATALDLIINNGCGIPCASCNPSTFNGPACNACASSCVAQGKCASN